MSVCVKCLSQSCAQLLCLVSKGFGIFYGCITEELLCLFQTDVFFFQASLVFLIQPVIKKHLQKLNALRNLQLYIIWIFDYCYVLLFCPHHCINSLCITINLYTALLTNFELFLDFCLCLCVSGHGWEAKIAAGRSTWSQREPCCPHEATGNG